MAVIIVVALVVSLSLAGSAFMLGVGIARIVVRRWKEATKRRSYP